MLRALQKFVHQRSVVTTALVILAAMPMSAQQPAATGNPHVQLWTTYSQGQMPAAIDQANRMLAASPNDPLAAAVLLYTGATRNVQPFELAQQALAGYSQLQNPGLDAQGFYSMQRFIASTLSAAAGEGFLARGDYESARRYLQRAVEVDPNNGRSVYSLAQAYLSGANPDLKQGYWFLARAVNLTRGVAGGEQIANYARQKYTQAGGSSADWDRFVAAAVTPASGTTQNASAASAQPATAGPAQPAVASAAPAQTTTVTPPVANTAPAQATASQQPQSAASSSTPAPQPNTAPTVTATVRAPATTPAPQSQPPSPAQATQANPAPRASVNTTTAAPPVTSQVPPVVASTQPERVRTREDEKIDKEAAQEEKSEEDRKRRLAELKERLEQPAPGLDAPKPAAPPPQPSPTAGSPISIGVVIQTEKADGASRKAVINGLSDMVRHLRNNDEAFVLSFGETMVLEEDLTSNSKLLERAMDDIKGQSGAALYDAVSFSAGHLARIAKNRNRALLVIADGAAQSSSVSPFQLSQDIENSGVRIFCIGMDVSSAADQQRLMALASNTGGQAMFISGANQFRNATRQVALRLGVSY